MPDQSTPHQSTPHQSTLHRSSPCCNMCSHSLPAHAACSRGIRQQLYNLSRAHDWRGRYNALIGGHEDVPGSYSDLLASSKFCLVLPGERPWLSALGGLRPLLTPLAPRFVLSRPRCCRDSGQAPTVPATPKKCNTQS
eukprot:366528-Chlamydomonas_euryale.AAC.17